VTPAAAQLIELLAAELAEELLATNESPSPPGDVSPASECQRGAGAFYTEAGGATNATHHPSADR